MCRRSIVCLFCLSILLSHSVLISHVSSQDTNSSKWSKGGFFDKDKVSSDMFSRKTNQAGQSSNSSGSVNAISTSHEGDDNKQTLDKYDTNRKIAIDSVPHSTSVNNNKVNSIKEKIAILNKQNPNSDSEKTLIEQYQKQREKSTKSAKKAMETAEDSPYGKKMIDKVEQVKEELKKIKKSSEQTFINGSHSKNIHLPNFANANASLDSKKSIDLNATKVPPLISPKCKVSLIISAVPERELSRALENIVELRTKKNVAIGELVVVGADDEEEKKYVKLKKWAEDLTKEKKEASKSLDSRKATDSNLQPQSPVLPDYYKESPIHKSNFVVFQSVIVKGLFEKFNIQKSPAWLVNYSGTNYLVEGPDTIWNMFDKSGDFIQSEDIKRDLAKQSKLNKNDPKKNSTNKKHKEKKYTADDTVAQSTLVMDADPVIKIASSASKTQFKIGRMNEKVYKYAPDL